MKKSFVFLTTTCLLLSTSIHSQVTIGSGQTPNEGALLDLKTETDGSSKLGLGLPRVQLTNLAPTSNADFAKSIGNTTDSYDMAEHAGLMVYNVKEAVYNPATCKFDGAPLGIHVWDGNQWQGLGTNGVIGTADPLESETATTLTDRDGNTYRIASFGAAGIWMTENLYTKTVPGLGAMTESASPSTTDMYYAYPNGGDPYVLGQPGTWTPQEGLFYNWYATMNKRTCATADQAQVAGATPGPGEVETTYGFVQGICPFGWHVPSDREWNILEKEIATKTSLYTQTPLANGSWNTDWETIDLNRGTAHGTAMKSKKFINSVDPLGDSKTSTTGGIDILLVGSGAHGSVTSYGIASFSWSASSYSYNAAWVRALITNSLGSSYSVNRNFIERGYLASVRCKKN